LEVYLLKFHTTYFILNHSHANKHKGVQEVVDSAVADYFLGLCGRNFLLTEEIFSTSIVLRVCVLVFLVKALQ